MTCTRLASFGLLAFLIMNLTFISQALAIDCARAIPSKATQHWTYRLIDGQKCWYEGRAQIPKSSLHWPQVAQAMAQASEADYPSVQQQPSAMTHGSVEQGETSFESRWQAMFDQQ